MVRDIFIAKIRYKNIQRELCIRPGATPEETLKSALLQEKGAQTASNLQKQLGYPSLSGSFSHQGSNSAYSARIKQEPTFSVQGKKLSDRINRAQMYSRSKGNFNTEKAKLCYFCGNKFSANHKQSCPARNVTCRQGDHLVCLNRLICFSLFSVCFFFSAVCVSAYIVFDPIVLTQSRIFKVCVYSRKLCFQVEMPCLYNEEMRKQFPWSSAVPNEKFLARCKLVSRLLLLRTSKQLSEVESLGRSPLLAFMLMGNLCHSLRSYHWSRRHFGFVRKT